MAQLTINQCQNCGKILAPGVTKCGKCHTEHSIAPAVVNPLRFSAAEAAEYKAQFQAQVEACPKDSNALFAMGLTYLGLKNYELADEHFVKAVHLTPSNPDVYYYTALSMFHHRSVLNLSKAEMGRIEEWLDTAVQMQPKRKYLILQMILRQGMSSMGINTDVGKKAPAELMAQARQTVQEEDELYEIEQHVLLTDEKTNQLLEALNKTPNSNENGYSDTLDNAIYQYDDFCEYPREKDYQRERAEVAALSSEEERRRFFESLYPPAYPEKISLPGFLSPLILSAIRLVGIAVVIFVVAVFMAFVEWVADRHLDAGPSIKHKVEWYTDVMKNKKGKELKRYEEDMARAIAREKEKVQEFVATYDLFLFITKDEAGGLHFSFTPFTAEQMANPAPGMIVMGKVPGWKGWAGILLYILPILWWVISTIVLFYLCVAARKDARHQNKANLDEYERSKKAYETRPSVNSYKTYCALYAGPNGTSLIKKGDFVAQALKVARISELDVQNGNGKIFFSCYFVDADSDNNPSRDPRVTLRYMPVRVCVAMRDSVIYMHGVWDTREDDFTFESQERLLYSQIANISNDSENYNLMKFISHSNTVLANVIYGYGRYMSIFQYQSIDPSDTVTYSTTRTSDINEFYNSLMKMHADYNRS